MTAIRKILVANRGEIAVRVMRTARDLGVETVAVYSDADAGAMHVAMADQAVRIGPAPVAESYLRGEAIIEAAKATGADAIHPGYGFLSENPAFVESVAKAGLIFLGPSADAIRAMGLKDKAKALMETSGVPVVPGYHGEDQAPALLAEKAAEIGYPVLIKARAGGGGKGMRLVEQASDFEESLASAQREGQASFGDPACLIEKYIQNPRHIEVQVLGDSHGNVVHLFERDCSLQRRHQKVIEEAPAPGMSDEMRAAMGAAAVAAAKAVDYVGAGTVEFIVDGAAYPSPQSFWFMEMNTRLQVEHPVTEAITGLDLVALQVLVAEGKPLPFRQEDLSIKGHAFEARLYAEDAGAGFLPATGTLDYLAFGEGTGVRIDTGVRQGDDITPFYDPMIAKVITSGPDRDAALARLVAALKGTQAIGSVTNRAFLVRLAEDADFAVGTVDTGLIERKQDVLTREDPPQAEDYALAALTVLMANQTDHANFRLFGPARQTVRLDGDVSVTVATSGDGHRDIETPLGNVTLTSLNRNDDVFRYEHSGARTQANGQRIGQTILVRRGGTQHEFSLYDPAGVAEDERTDAIVSPMPGLVIQVATEVGALVEEGQTLVVLEAMKMDHRLTAGQAGRVAELTVAAGAQVAQGELLIRFEDAED